MTPTNSRGHFYRDKARLYDLLYSEKDYRAEAARISELIDEYKRSSGNDLLDVACGTGKHLEHFRERFACTGVDLNPEMLAIARERIPAVELIEADMTEIRLGKTFDVISCLFSAIGYVKTPERLAETLRNFAAHLNPGGVLVIQPWFTPDAWIPGAPHMQLYADDDIKVARLSVSDVRDDLAVIDFHFTVAERSREVEYFVDHHELGLFGIDETLHLMEDAGFEPRFLPEESGGRGLYVAVKSL